MGVDDLFGFSTKTYKAHIRSYSDPDLCRNEVTKIRQINGAGFKVGAGVAGAYFTGGVTLLGSALGGRQMNIACRKLACIRELMEERGLPFHEETKRDILIPCAASAVGFAVGAGVHVGMDHLVSGAAETLAQQGVENVGVHLTTETVASAATANAGDFVHGAVEGAAANIAQIASLGEVGNAGVNAAVATMPHLLEAGASQSAIVGDVCGQVAMQHAEQAGLTTVAAFGTAAVLDKVPVGSRKAKNSTTTGGAKKQVNTSRDASDEKKRDSGVSVSVREVPESPTSDTALEKAWKGHSGASNKFGSLAGRYTKLSTRRQGLMYKLVYHPNRESYVPSMDSFQKQVDACSKTAYTEFLKMKQKKDGVYGVSALQSGARKSAVDAWQDAVKSLERSCRVWEGKMDAAVQYYDMVDRQLST